MKLSLSSLSAFLGIIGTIAGGVFVLESRYANADEVKTSIVKLEKRIKINELKDTKNAVLKRKYFLLDQIQQIPDSVTIKRELEEVESDLKDVKEQIKALQGIKDGKTQE